MSMALEWRVATICNNEKDMIIFLDRVMWTVKMLSQTNSHINKLKQIGLEKGILVWVETWDQHI